MRCGAMPFRINAFERQSAMLNPFEDPQQGDLGRLSFDQVLPVELGDDALELATFESGPPAITRHQVGDGKVVWFLSSANERWSNWPTSPLYLPIVHQMAADLLNLTGEGLIRFRLIGDEQTINAEMTGQAANEIREVSRNAASVSPSHLDVSPVPAFQRDGEVVYVVNPPAKESDPTRIEASAFVEQFQLTVADETGRSRCRRD